MYFFGSGGAPFTGGTLSSAILAPDGTAASPAYSFSAATNWGIYRNTSLGLIVSILGANAMSLGNAPTMQNAANFGFSASDATAAQDTILWRRAAGIWATATSSSHTARAGFDAKLGYGNGTTPVASVGNTAAITTTALLTGTANTAGVYRLSYYHVTSQAATTSGSSQLTISWNDGLVAQSVTDTTLTNTLGNLQQGAVVIRVPASQNISYAATYASSGATVYKFDLYVQLEQLQ